jgi:DNA-binding NtrC family response regulator
MCNVLVVDDEAAIRGLITRWLEAAGYRTHAAVNAEQAIAELGPTPPAVVVSDIEMPGRDGFWLADQIHRRFPTTAIVMMTGSLDTGMAVRSIRTGAMDYLRKPFTRDQLTASLNRALQWHRSQAPMEAVETVAS